ncbi:NHL domain-containing protein [Larkinella rosea]|nr:putative Ig domain-containing protein [Larkinella rosea]
MKHVFLFGWLCATGLFFSSVLKAQTITTIAGSGSATYGGDNGPATSAKLNFPYAVALDAQGNLYIVDCSNHRVRKVSTSGTITTIAGRGTLGYGGDGGQATNAYLFYPTGVALDAAGNVYIADQRNNRIRKVALNGIITTVAGKGDNTYSGDGGQATQANISRPSNLIVDAEGSLIIADQYTQRIRKVTTDGIINTIAGSTVTPGFGGDNGSATSAKLNFPAGVAQDASGNLYIADQQNHRIRKVSADGVITTVAGNGTGGYGGDGGPATSAKLWLPNDVTVDAQGNLYIADYDNNRIRKVSPDGIITTVAGNGEAAFGGDGGPATSASLHRPNGVCVDAAGNLYIADAGNNRIRKVTPAIVPTNTAPTLANVIPPQRATVGEPFTYTIPANTFTDDETPTSLTLSASGVPNSLTFSNGTFNGSFSTTIGSPFSVTVTAIDPGGLSASGTFTLSVQNALPTISGFEASPNPVCVGSSVLFTATIGNVSESYAYTLTNGTGNARSGTSGGHDFSQALTVGESGSQSFTLTVEQGDQMASASTSILVNSLPEARITASNAGILTCASPVISLTASGGSTYRWEDNSVDPVRSVGSTGTYSVTVTSGNGCTASTNVVIDGDLTPPPPPNLTSTTVTQGSPSVILTADNCPGTLSWTGPGNTSGTGPITVSTDSRGTFRFQATCAVDACVSSPGEGSVVVAAIPVAGSFDGFIYGADCATFRGWVWDRNKPNAVITIDILDGTELVATIPAGEFRQDLLDQKKGNGRHAFFWPIPENLKDGLPHRLSAQVTGNDFVLKDSPKVLICQVNTMPDGNKPPTPPVPTVLIAPLAAQVGVPFSGTLVPFTDPEAQPLAYKLTGLPQGLTINEISRVISGTPLEAGTFVLTYQATETTGSNPLTNSVSFPLTVSPASTTAVTGDFEGYLDKLDCGGIRGWVWDRKKPNAPLTVEFYLDGSAMVLGSTVANIYRVDLKDAGKGNGTHAYNFTPPGSITNGTLVLARVLGSNFVLKGSPKAYQCAPARLLAETDAELTVTILGNPVDGETVEVEIRGAVSNQRLSLELTNLRGWVVDHQLVDNAAPVERHRFLVKDQPPGLLMLRVSTPTQTKTVKILKTH